MEVDNEVEVIAEFPNDEVEIIAELKPKVQAAEPNGKLLSPSSFGRLQLGSTATQRGELETGNRATVKSVVSGRNSFDSHATSLRRQFRPLDPRSQAEQQYTAEKEDRLSSENDGSETEDRSASKRPSKEVRQLGSESDSMESEGDGKPKMGSDPSRGAQKAGHRNKNQPSKKNPAKCPKCLQAFFSQETFKRHMTFHLFERDEIDDIYVCTCPTAIGVCGATFENYRAMRRHLGESHGKRKTFTCLYRAGDKVACGKEFFDSMQLTQHKIESHTIDAARSYDHRSYRRCDIHKQSSNRRCTNRDGEVQASVDDTLERSIRSKEESDTATLPESEADGKNNMTINESATVPVDGEQVREGDYSDNDSERAAVFDERLFKCIYNGCDKRYKQKSRLNDHIRSTHEGARPHACSQCSKSFASRRRLTQHELTHSDRRPYRCNKCDYSGKTSSALWTHEKRHGTSKDHLCMKCPKSFRTLRDLRRHDQFTHQRLLKLECVQCRQRFRGSSHLKDHVNAVHLKNKQHKCSHAGCTYAGATTKALREHMHVHGGARYECDECGGYFLRGDTYRRHKRYHQQPGPYSCEVCGKEFKASHNLRVHSQVHLPVENRTDLCLYCGRRIALRNKDSHTTRCKQRPDIDNVTEEVGPSSDVGEE